MQTPFDRGSPARILKAAVIATALALLISAAASAHAPPSPISDDSDSAGSLPAGADFNVKVAVDPGF
jgi:hypothetical protein